MDEVNHQPPREDTFGQASCKKCGKPMVTETVTVGAGVPIPHRKVVGSYVQFVDADGIPFGPWWAVCEPCQTDPLVLPEVRAAYEKLKTKEA